MWRHIKRPLVQYKSLVVVCYDVIALLNVFWEAANIGHKNACFSFNIGADIPELHVDRSDKSAT